MTNELLLVLAGLYVTTLGVGYVLGRLHNGASTQMDRPGSFLKTAARPPLVSTVDIDSRKYVAPIDTAGMMRGDSTNSIGKTTATKDDIQGSVSKLAQLKGK